MTISPLFRDVSEEAMTVVKEDITCEVVNRFQSLFDELAEAKMIGQMAKLDQRTYGVPIRSKILGAQAPLFSNGCLLLLVSEFCTSQRTDRNSPIRSLSYSR